MRFDNSVKKLVLVQIQNKIKTCTIARNFGISRDTIRRWKNLIKLDEKEENIDNKNFFKIIKNDKINTRIYDYQAIKKHIDENPSCTQKEIIDKFNCSKGTVWNVLNNIRYTRKKKFKYQEQNPEKLIEYEEKLEIIPIEKRYFLDECGINKELIREFGYSLKGQEIHDKKSGKRHSNTTIIAFCNKKTNDEKYKLITPKYQKTPMNTELFCEYLQESLPKLPPNSWLIWDNVAFHKSKKVVELVAKLGHNILCLSAYSPDQNPIEHLWRPLKNHISNLAKTVVNFYDRINGAFELMT